MNPLVSIIAPVYHVEEYLSECIESVLNQTYKNIELILVDDGGDDSCPQICESYAEKDSRVICVHKENEGQSFARKTGLEKANGDYIMYIDSDDSMEQQTVEQSLNAAEKYQADIVIFGYKRIYENHVFDSYIFEQDKVFEKSEIDYIHRRLIGLVKDELKNVELADRLAPMWGKMYSRKAALSGEFVSERRFGSSEDAIYNLGAFQSCNRCVYINKAFYRYRKTNDNATTKKYRENLASQWKDLFSYLDAYIEDNNLGDEYKEAMNNRVILSLLGLGLNELSSPKSFSKKAKELKLILCLPRWEKAYANINLDYFSFKWKVFFSLCQKKRTGILLLMLYAVSKLKSVKEK
ncbi:MAG: glycosyltransferase family 2 protein [Acutalibacteraceae bacterium]